MSSDCCVLLMSVSAKQSYSSHIVVSLDSNTLLMSGGAGFLSAAILRWTSVFAGLRLCGFAGGS